MIRRASSLILLVLLLVFPASAAKAGTVVTLATNGPSITTLNVVFLGDGFTNGQSAAFFAASTNAFAAITNVFGPWHARFNGVALLEYSDEAGSDHPTEGVYRDTRYSTSYDGGYVGGSDRVIICVGSSQAIADANTITPATNRLIVVLVNDTEYGGGGGSVLTASLHASSAEIAAHEMGHTLPQQWGTNAFANSLGDEYTTAYPGYPSIEEYNTTTNGNPATVKWAARQAQVFTGAHYHSSGWYRAYSNCKMRNLGQPYCAECTYWLTNLVALHTSTAPPPEIVAAPRFLRIRVEP